MTDCCYFVNGKVYLLDSRKSGGWSFLWGFAWGAARQDKPVGRYIGNVESLTITIDRSFQQQVRNENYYNISECANVSVNGVNVSMTVRCASKENILLGFYGTESNTSAASAVVDESVYMPISGFTAGSLIPFNNLGVDFSSVTLKTSDNTLLIKNVDYKVTEFGLELVNTLNLASGVYLKISYSYASPTMKVEALTAKPKARSLLFAGIDAQTGKPVAIRMHKVLFAPVSSFDFISKDFASLTIEGIMLTDESIKSDALSKYYTIEKIN